MRKRTTKENLYAFKKIIKILHKSGYSSITIGKILGRDHTTILHHMRHIKKIIPSKYKTIVTPIIKKRGKQKMYIDILKEKTKTDPDYKMYQPNSRSGDKIW